ncbi:MAG: Dabb family protein [Armatimonadota bacterium]
MIEHIVLFKMKQGVTEQQRTDFIEALKALRDTVPGIRELTAGRNLNEERGQGYEIALLVRFDSKEALDAYGPHPAHQDIVQKCVLPWCDSIIVADYEA